MPTRRARAVARIIFAALSLSFFMYVHGAMGVVLGGVCAFIAARGGRTEDA